MKVHGATSTTSKAGTASWVLWFNSERPHGSIDDLAPLEVEQLDYARIEPVEQAG